MEYHAIKELLLLTCRSRHRSIVLERLVQNHSNMRYLFLYYFLLMPYDLTSNLERLVDHAVSTAWRSDEHPYAPLPIAKPVRYRCLAPTFCPKCASCACNIYYILDLQDGY